MKKIIYFLPLLLVFALATASPLGNCVSPGKTHINKSSLADFDEPFETGKSPVIMFKF